MSSAPRKTALAAALAVLAAGCADNPDLAASTWRSLEIEYCLPGGEARILVTERLDMLEQLRISLGAQPPKGLTMILKSYTNELRLTLASGQKWYLYFRDKPTTITFHDPNSLTRSFVMDVAGEFYERLSAALKGAGGPPISLKGDCRIPAMDEKPAAPAKGGTK